MRRARIPARRLPSLGLVAIAAVVACTNDYDGIAPAPGGGGSSNGPSSQGAGRNAPASVGGASSSGLGGAGGGGGGGNPAGTGGAGGAACGTTLLGTHRAAAYASAQPKAIDGNVDDWGCAEPLILDARTADHVESGGLGAPDVSAHVRFEWDGEALYFVAEVFDDSPGQGNDPNEPYNNDSVELYLRGTTPPNADYLAHDHHYMIDHANRVLEHSPPTVDNDQTPNGLETAVQGTPTGYRVEARIEAEVVGGSWQVGRALGMDLLVADGEGQPQFLVWALAAYDACGQCDPSPSCCCQGGGSTGELPYCNALLFGELELR